MRQAEESLIVRPASPDDAAGIVGILNPIIESGKFTAFDAPFTVETERQYILNFPQRGIFHVAVQDSKILGFQSMEPFATYTHAFDHVGVIATYVDLSHLRQGIASRLFEATLKAAESKGYEKLFTYIRADNPAALSTYRKQGFEVVGTARKQAKFEDRYVDEIVVEKFLQSEPFR